MRSAFERPEVVASYEDWFRTAYGRMVEQIEVDLILGQLAPIAGGATVLDIGCGTGWFGARMVEHGFTVTGVDPSCPMLARAKSRFRVACGDATKLPFGDGAFDAAYLIAVLDFVPDPVAVLREARRVVRSRVTVTALASGSWLGMCRRAAARRGHPIYSQARPYSRHDVLAIARAAGCEPERVRGALFLPAAIAARAPLLERALHGRCTLGAGIIAFSLPAASGGYS